MILIEKLLFYLLIFFLPFQTRKIFYQWGDSFNEWTSIYLYLTDILVLFLFLFWFLRLKNERFLKNINWEWFGRKVRNPSFWLVFFLLISFTSLVQARNMGLGFYAWFKLLEFVLFFFYLKTNIVILGVKPEGSIDSSLPEADQNDKKEVQNRSLKISLKRLSQVLIASGFIQSLIALGQYFNQKSLGLHFLRESSLGININGVAKIGIDNFNLIRAYGGLPHPNLLALFLFLSIFSLYYLWLNKKHSFRNYSILSIVFFFLFFGLFLTFSRLIIFTFFLSSLIYFIFLFREHKKQILSLFCLLLASCFLLLAVAWPEISSRFQLSINEQSIGLRSFYNETAFSIIEGLPLLGIGLGNFVWLIQEIFIFLPNWVYQPVHNIYLLIASETGLIGLVIFLLFLFQLLKKSFKKENIFLLILVFSFLFIGFFDHFFWTLQQGSLVFWLILGLSASKLST